MRVSVFKRFSVMIQLDEKKLAKFKTTNQLLDEKYGEHGTPTRDAFNEKCWHGIMEIYFGIDVRLLS